MNDNAEVRGYYMCLKPNTSITQNGNEPPHVRHDRGGRPSTANTTPPPAPYSLKGFTGPELADELELDKIV